MNKKLLLISAATSALALCLVFLCATPAAQPPKPPSVNALLPVRVVTEAATTTLTEPETQPAETVPVETEPAEVNGSGKATLAATGDLMLHLKNLKAGYNSKTKTFSFTRFFELVKPYLSKADFTFGNLETTMAGGEKFDDYTGFPLFNSPDAFADALVDAGYDMVTTANNHMLDTGFTGLSRTLDVLDSAGLKHTGSARTAEEADTPLICEINGIRFGFLAYTYKMNITRTPDSMKSKALNVFSKEKALRDISATKSAGAEVVIVCLHWGPDENVTKPSAAYKSAVQTLLDGGADGIIGHHPHVLQSMEWIETTRNGETVRCPVLYSLGNFHCNPANDGNAESCIAYLTFERQADGKITCTKMAALPTYIWRIKTEPRDFILIPIGLDLDDESVYNKLGLDNRKKLTSGWDNIVKSLGSQPEIIRK